MRKGSRCFYLLSVNTSISLCPLCDLSPGFVTHPQTCPVLDLLHTILLLLRQYLNVLTRQLLS